MFGDQLWPILFGISFVGNIALLCPLVKRLLHREDAVSEDNIMAMVEEGEEAGSIQSNEKELIENVFEFDTLTARDLMVHRTDMETLALDDDEQTILDTIRRSGLSRFPVYEEDADDIVGILSTREYLLNFHPGANHDIEAYLENNGLEVIEARMTDVIRKTYFCQDSQIKAFRLNRGLRMQF